MDKLKVYTSTSKQGSFADVMKVNDELAKHPVIPMKFEGGAYSSAKLEESDVFILIPPKVPTLTDQTSLKQLHIGKGQLTEYQIANEADKECYCLVYNQDGILQLREINHVAIINGNWSDNFATIDLDPMDWDFDEAFEIAADKFDRDYPGMHIDTDPAFTPMPDYGSPLFEFKYDLSNRSRPRHIRIVALLRGYTKKL